MEFCTGIASGSPVGVSSLSAASPLLSVPHPAVPSSSLPAFQPQGVSGFSPLTLLSCLRLPCRGLSLLLLAGALLRWFQCFLVTCGALPGTPLLSAASVAAPIGSSVGL